ncbi:MAG: hypothetical protein DSZ07_00370 [Sulfurovum sp.]|nr:MAG: hypothetical protein DSZ07_00370 [Sulfurovum sp.]
MFTYISFTKKENIHIKYGHLRWDSLGEFLALAESLKLRGLTLFRNKT